MGLREEKKKKTRAAISLFATKLFIERGYDEVTTAEIAERAGVSVPTLFKYFPTKEALVFDEDEEREQLLVDTVRNRRKGQSMSEALLDAGLKKLEEIERMHKSETKRFFKLIDRTPALSLYAQQMWLRHAQALASVIREESKKQISIPESKAIARFILDSFHRAIADANPKSTLRTLFKLLRSGWSE